MTLRSWFSWVLRLGIRTSLGLVMLRYHEAYETMTQVDVKSVARYRSLGTSEFWSPLSSTSTTTILGNVVFLQRFANSVTVSKGAGCYPLTLTSRASRLR